MSKLNLNNVTLVAISSVKTEETLAAIQHCLNLCSFNNVVFFTDFDSEYTFKIDRINSITDYNNFVYYELPNKIYDDFALIIQWDGFIVNPHSWTNKFLEYDYIGAPWPWVNHQCGNGGFSLRSKKFLETQNKLSKIYKLKDDIHQSGNEDVMLCRVLRDEFIKNGCRYSTPEIGYQFATEHGNYNENKSFGFHRLDFHPQFRLITNIER